jgi:y4mF family transcriptional regulator
LLLILPQKFDKIPFGKSRKVVMTTKELGAIIRKTRKAQGMTQPQLAMACGTGIRFIVELEAGKETCQLGKALLVVQMLGLNLDIAGQN